MKKSTARKRGAAGRRALPQAKLRAKPRRGGVTGTRHVTPAGGNVFADLGFSPEEAENLKVRARLMLELGNVISGMTQANAAVLLGVSQPRVSDLKRGKIGLFTIDALVNMLAHAGLRLRVTLMKTGNRAA